MRDFRYMPTVLRSVTEWTNRVFTKRTEAGLLAHIRREVDELARSPDDPDELADLVILACCYAGLKGWDLEHQVGLKMIDNLGRTWGEPDADGVVEHIR